MRPSGPKIDCMIQGRLSTDYADCTDYPKRNWPRKSQEAQKKRYESVNNCAFALCLLCLCAFLADVSGSAYSLDEILKPSRCASGASHTTETSQSTPPRHASHCFALLLTGAREQRKQSCARSRAFGVLSFLA